MIHEKTQVRKSHAAVPLKVVKSIKSPPVYRLLGSLQGGRGAENTTFPEQLQLTFFPSQKIDCIDFCFRP